MMQVAIEVVKAISEAGEESRRPTAGIGVHRHSRKHGTQSMQTLSEAAQGNKWKSDKQNIDINEKTKKLQNGDAF